MSYYVIFTVSHRLPVLVTANFYEVILFLDSHLSIVSDCCVYRCEVLSSRPIRMVSCLVELERNLGGHRVFTSIDPDRILYGK